MGVYKLSTVLNIVKKASLEGIILPLTTPFNERQEILYDKLKDNLDKYERLPLTGYVVAGWHGETAALSNQEKVDLVRKVKQFVSPTKVVIGGATSESTTLTCDLCNEMATAGANAVLVMSPLYYNKRISEEAVYSHFETIANNSRVPVVLHNMVSTTGADISLSTLSRLADHPNIVGIKVDDEKKMSAVVKETHKKGTEFKVVAGSASFLLPAIQAGCVGSINGLACILGGEVCELYRLGVGKKWQDAANLQEKLSAYDSLLISKLGVPGLKKAMDLLGLYGGPCRQPYMPLSSDDTAKIRTFLQQNDMID